MLSFSIGCFLLLSFFMLHFLSCRFCFWSLTNIRYNLLIRYRSNSPVKNSLISVMQWRNYYQRHFLLIRGNIHTAALSLNPLWSNGCTERIEEVMLSNRHLTTRTAYCRLLCSQRADFTPHYWEQSVPREPWSVTATPHKSQARCKNFISVSCPSTPTELHCYLPTM